MTGPDQIRVLLEAVEWAVHDQCTGLLTRDAWSARAGRGVRQHPRPGVLIIDVDHFKAWNDRWGHPCGDEVLRRVAWSVRSEVRHIDVVGRYGGDEFVVLLTGEQDSRSIVSVAERVRGRVAALRVSGPEGAVLGAPTVSIGCCLASPQADLAGLVAGADRALYVAKRSGRDAVRLDALLGPSVRRCT